ncbi:MAG: matrixin family metalloprotease, partial [Acidimicrobiales bacterium]
GELLKTVLRHELSHAMGLQHSGDCGALLSSPDAGGCVPRAGTSWTNHDIAAIENFYLRHAVD